MVPGHSPQLRVSRSVSGKPYRLPIATGHKTKTATWVHPRIWVSMWCELGALFWHWQVWVPLIIWRSLSWPGDVVPFNHVTRGFASRSAFVLHLIGCPDVEQTGNIWERNNMREPWRNKEKQFSIHISTFLASDMWRVKLPRALACSTNMERHCAQQWPSTTLRQACSNETVIP